MAALKPPVAGAFIDNKWPPPWFDVTGFGSSTSRDYLRQFNAYHTGADLNRRDGNDFGQPCYAVADGIVLHAGRISAWKGGDVVVIQHKDFTTRYAHVKTAVVAGDNVRAGAVIATIDDYPPDGRLGDHLHFDICVTDILSKNPTHWPRTLEGVLQHYVEPLPFLLSYSVGVATRYRVTAHEGVRVRISPSQTSLVIGVLPYDAVVEAEPHGAWLALTLNAVEVSSRVTLQRSATGAFRGYALRDFFTSVA